MQQVIDCPECDGRGYHYDLIFIGFTLGLGALLGDKEDYTDECEFCKGAGKVIAQLVRR